LKPGTFLSSLPKEQKEFLNLLELTAKVHGESKTLESTGKEPIWHADFFHVKNSLIWHSLPAEIQNSILLNLGHKIFQEAYFIECAGMSYAAKMNLAAKSKEEREFFCFVGEEEARHLRLIEALGGFSISLENIPSFALLIGEIIHEAHRPSHLLLIQILLEGWGLSYYKNLSKFSKDEAVSQVFKQIIKDEIRHHSGGVLLFSQVKETSEFSDGDQSEFFAFLERIAFMVKIGPWNLCDQVFKHLAHPTKNQLETFLVECEAVDKTAEKMQLLEQLLEKNLPKSVLKTIKEKKILEPMNLIEMTEALSQSISGTFQLESDR
jgi:rubrerythrin